MKTVFSNDMVAHVWAQQSQSEGRNSGGSLYFRDSMIFSYRDSAPLARFVEHKGRRAVLHTIESYSITTSGHQSRVRRAVHGVPAFNVLHVIETRHADNMANYKARLDAAILRAARANGNGAEYRMNEAIALANEANGYAEFFGLRTRLPVPEWTDEFKAKARARATAATARKAAQTRERDKAQRLAWQEAADMWLACHPDARLPFNFPDTLLRINGDLVQTSKGAEVPLEHARRLWPIIERVRQSGTPYVRNGHTEHVGHFAVDRIDTSGDLTIGCHRIKFDQVQRIARELGL